MKNKARELKSIITAAEQQLAQLSNEETAVKPAPDEWSKKEILGHLIDSAANNHQRFVRGAYDAAADFPAYSQNEWVSIQKYNERSWISLVALWSAYNNHLCHLIECIPEDAESNPCNIGQDKPASLNFVVKDYIDHLHHHLKDLL